MRFDGGPLPEDIVDRTILGRAEEVLPALKDRGAVDLLVADPPYTLRKTYNGRPFRATNRDAYRRWLETWLGPAVDLLGPTASVYVCAEWRCSALVQAALEERLIVRNRITWQREKGRGAKGNWKNAAEDIWYATVSDEYTFNVDAVKLARRVRAPYRTSDGQPKDWDEETGLRLTHPGNVWTDLTVPFWSMPENTDHPTQKPEKLLAKVLLASSNPGDVVLDPFVGSGTTAVVAKKLGRRFIAIEQEEEYALLTERRLELADEDPSIQGYDGVFRERNG